MLQYPTLTDIQAAAARIKPYAHRTPVLTCTSLNRLVGAELWCKCENFQKVGAFKFRGACNTVWSLSEPEAQHGVATHSSGNHAAAVALAAQLRGIKAHIVMPDNAPAVKKAAVAGYGGTIVYCAPTLAAREATLERVVHETGATFIHPYNDARVVAGQGTAALELLTDVPDLDVIMAPVGGGGLLSGTAVVTAALSAATQVIDGTGKTLLPGFVMVHEHFFYPSSVTVGPPAYIELAYSAPRLYLGAGVTTARTGGSMEL